MGARVQAKSDQGEKVTAPWEHGISAYQNHAQAIRKLLAQMNFRDDATVSHYEKGLIAIIGGFKL
jgi:hypothetical protein